MTGRASRTGVGLEVLARLKGIARDATVLEANMVALARERLGDLTRATSIASAR